MDAKEIFNKALNTNFFIIQEDQLKTVLDYSELLRVEDTYLSDLIRVLKYDNKLFLQETTLKDEIIIRKVNSIKDAENFVKERLDFYERKWDGCGCKIDYFE